MSRLVRYACSTPRELTIAYSMGFKENHFLIDVSKL